MQTRTLVSVLAGLALALPARGATGDPRAIAVADRVMQALGGEQAWNATRYLRFDFAVERGGRTLARRAHTWDKWTGRYRVSGKDKDGHEVVVLMNLGTHEGTATSDGRPLTGAALKSALDDAFAWWTNDAYWLLMPYKMHDAGVHLAYGGEQKQGADTWDTVVLTFDNVGLTPRDKYWVFVNRRTSLVDRWQFVLKGASTPPVPFEWKGWAKHGRIMLADDRVSPKDDTRIHFPVLDVPASVPDDAFTKP